MAFTLQDLLPVGQQLRTVQAHDTVASAIDIMHQYGYGQLPVVGINGEYQGLAVTFESVIRAIQAFRVEIGTLLIRDAAERVREYSPDADLLTTLDDIHRRNFAMIVDNQRLVGIVTTADAAVFFREYAEDLMVIEGIESRIRDAIRSLYAEDHAKLEAAIIAVTDRTAEVRKKLPGAIRAYLGKLGITAPTNGTDIEAVALAEQRLGLREPAKGFDDLTFDEYTSVMFRHSNAPKLSKSSDVFELRGLGLPGNLYQRDC